MANILTYIEISDNKATPASLCALNTGRLVATKLGATLYALLPCASTPSYGDDDIIAVLSRHGADKVILTTHPRLTPPVFFATHGEALRAACRQFPPKLFLFPSSGATRDLAPRLAVALSGTYCADARIEEDPDGFRVARTVFRRRVTLFEPMLRDDGPLVVTLSPQGSPQVMGDDEAEVLVVHAPVTPSPPLEVLACTELNEEPLVPELPASETARIVVAGGGGLASVEDFQLIEDLARRVGGAATASRTAREKALASADSHVGIDGVAVDAEIYLLFGVSGSERHVAGIGPRTTVVAVNSDPNAPVFDIAQYKLVADARQTLDALFDHLGGPDPSKGAA